MFRRQGRTRSDFHEELQSHLELEAGQLQADGLSPEEARAAARRAFGNVTAAEERFYESRRVLWLDQLLRDLRFAVRNLRKSSGFTLAALLTLALGLGANTAIFTLVNGVMLRMLPVQHPEELVVLELRQGAGAVETFSYPLYRELRDHNHVLAQLAALGSSKVALASDRGSHTVAADMVSGNYFPMLGLAPGAGRLLAPDDDRPGAAPVCVLSYGFWQQWFGGDPAAVGRTIRLNTKPFTIVGVTPAEFRSTEPGMAPDVRVPAAMQPLLDTTGADMLGDGSGAWLALMGRRKPGVSVEQASAGLQVLYEQLRQGRSRMPFRLVARPGGQGLGYLRQLLARPLLVLMGVTILVLLIACANLATLLLAREMARRNETAVRLMLGSGRGRLIAQALTESLLLAGAGAALGILVAQELVSGMMRLAPTLGGRPVVIDSSADWRVILFLAGAAVMTALLVGLAPAWSATRVDPAAVLRDASGGMRGRFLLRKMLVSAQVALSMVLLAGAGLFAGTLRSALHLKLGFQPDNLILMRLDPRASGYTDQNARVFYDRLLERVRALPGTRSAGLAARVPGSGGVVVRSVLPEGYQPQPGERLYAAANFVTPQYFATMRIPVLSGREFSDGDRAGMPPVVIVNRRFAARFWPGQSAVGKRLLGGLRAPGLAEEIVGVVADQQDPGAREQPELMIYTPFPQARMALPMVLHTRVSTAVGPMVDALRAGIAALDPHMPIADIKTMEGQLAEAISTERLMAIFSAAFAALALLLAALGLYGVVAYGVVRRTHELGIRIALGARPAHVLRLVVAETGVLLAAGLVAGIPAALAGARTVAGMLHGVHPYSVPVYATGILVLAGTALLAAFVPACKALRVNPAAALRHE